MSFLFIFRANTLARVNLELILLLTLIEELVFKALLIDKFPDLQINHVVKLSPSHPICKYDHKRHATDLHIIRSFIKISLLQPKMILLTIEIALGGKVSNTFFINIITDFPLLPFTKLVYNANDCTMAIRREIFLTYFTENPTSCTILAVNKLVNFDLTVVEIYGMRIVLCDEIMKIELKLISNQAICISQ